jgi:hypothetical protein
LATIEGDELDLLGATPARTARIPSLRAAVVDWARGGILAAGSPRSSTPAAESDGPSPTSRRVLRPSAGLRVLVTRAAEQADEIISALRNAGLDPVPVPSIAVELEPSRRLVDAAAGLHPTHAWVVITSANGARAILDVASRIESELGAPSWAAIGSATRGVLGRNGIDVDFQPHQSSADRHGRRACR